MDIMKNISGKRRASFRLIVISGISILLAVSFIPSKAVTKVNCPASKVIFFPNGVDEIVTLPGSNDPATTQTLCAVNGVVDVPKFSRAGYTLSGWTGEPDYGSEESIASLSANSETWTANAEVTRAFAQWQPIQYSVSYDYNGGVVGSATPISTTFNETIYAGAKIIDSVYSFIIPTKVGHSFVGWSFNNTTYAPGSLIEAPASNVVFTAVWVAA
jgi:hypothetical protein